MRDLEPAAVLAYLEKRTENQQRRIEDCDFRIKLIEDRLNHRVKVLEEKVAALQQAFWNQGSRPGGRNGELVRLVKVKE